MRMSWDHESYAHDWHDSSRNSDGRQQRIRTGRLLSINRDIAASISPQDALVRAVQIPYSLAKLESTIRDLEQRSRMRSVFGAADEMDFVAVWVTNIGSVVVGDELRA
jgi:hypothetical protein